MSACFSYGLAAGEPMKQITLAHGTAPLWQGLPVLVVVLLGGLTTNCIWCLLLDPRNKTGGQYIGLQLDGHAAGPILETATDAPGGRNGAPDGAKCSRTDTGAPRAQLSFCALAGLTWYFQFFFYTMGKSQMDQYKFSSWTLHMASITIFSTLWGLALSEWKGASRRAMTFLALSLAILVASTVIIGYGNYLAVSH